MRCEERVIQRLADALFSVHPIDGATGRLDNPDLPPIFSMARVDKIKNMSGLVEIFGKSPHLRDVSNLIIVSSLFDECVTHCLRISE